jgi:hypothetical protein
MGAGAVDGQPRRVDLAKEDPASNKPVDRLPPEGLAGVLCGFLAERCMGEFDLAVRRDPRLAGRCPSRGQTQSRRREHRVDRVVILLGGRRSPRRPAGTFGAPNPGGMAKSGVRGSVWTCT